MTPEEFHQVMLRLQTDRAGLLGEWMQAMCMLTTLEQGAYLANAIHGTRLIKFQRSGHVPMLEEPETFNSELLAFAEEVFAGPVRIAGRS